MGERNWGIWGGGLRMGLRKDQHPITSARAGWEEGLFTGMTLAVTENTDFTLYQF